MREGEVRDLKSGAIFIRQEVIILIMNITTITLKRKTKTRLSDYKHGDRSYDEIINMLMDKVPLEDITEEHIQEHLIYHSDRAVFLKHGGKRKSTGSILLSLQNTNLQELMSAKEQIFHTIVTGTRKKN